MFYTLDRAVKVAGLSKSTILGALECGRIKGAKDLFGEWQIEDGELHKIYPLLAQHADRDGAQHSATPVKLEAEMAALIQEAGESLRGQPSPGHRDSERLGLQPIATDPNVTGECSATPAKDFGCKTKEPGSERQAWHPDIRISDPERISKRFQDTQTTLTALIAGTILGALGVGWIVLQFFDRPFSIPGEERVHSSPQVVASKKQTSFGGPETAREAIRDASSTDKIASATASVPAHRHGSAQIAVQRPAAVKTRPAGQQNTGPSEAAASRLGHEPKTSPRPTPFPETRPTTIEGWMVRDVVDGTATLEGPGGVWRARHGDTVPGVGKIESIVRWGSRWIVATSRGLISTP